MREVGAIQEKARCVAFPPFRLDYANECLWCAGGRIDLTPKAFAVLKELVEASGELVTKERLLDTVWAETFVGDAVLKVSIGEIRRALGDACRAPRFIETVHRRGYRFIAPLESEAKEPLASSGFVPPVTHYTRSGDVNIAYQVLGDGPLDLIFVMGWISHLEYFWTEPSVARFLRRLASFSRLILFDKRGTGLSDSVLLSQLPTLEQRMDDVRAVMDAVGSERAAICGVSEGGIMSALFAATYPQKTLALIMIGPYAKRIRDETYPWGPSKAERETFYREILSDWGGPVGLEERAPSVAHDPHFREWWATYLRMGASPGAALALTQMNTEIDAREVLKNVRVPALVLHRKGDRCLLVEEGRYVASLLPNSRFVELAGIDHLPFVGDSDSIVDHMEEFLLGLRRTQEPDRVLATVLHIHFFQAGSNYSVALADLSSELSKSLAVDLRREIEWFRGNQIQLDGSPLALFDGPARAIRCACAVAERASWLGVTVSAGLHTGECDSRGVQPSGTAVRVAERIAQAAAPGEILVSSTVSDLVAGSGIDLKARGALQVGEFVSTLQLFEVRRSFTFAASALP
ncbi:MAG TPA: alpha/beta fold hydrolase [Bryobacteraceae bacterium]|jgi:pimeloyl-ACP methyl ester carboxylesterase